MPSLGNRSFQGNGLSADMARRLDQIAAQAQTTADAVKSFQQNYLTQSDAKKLYGIHTVKTQLETAGSPVALNIQNLVGTAASTAIPFVSVLPTTGSVAGQVAVKGDTLYIWDTTNPANPHWVPVGGIFTGTHSARLTVFTPLSVGVNVLFIETDRHYVYSVQSIGGVLTWVYVAGQMVDVTANQPSDLGTNDVYAVFVASDAGYTPYVWAGAAWHSLFGAAWTAYSPTVTPNGTMAWTPTSHVAGYQQIGKIVHFRAEVVGTLGAGSSSIVTLSLPVAPLNSNQTCVCAMINNSLTRVAVGWFNAGAADTSLDSGVAFTAGATTIRIEGVYEAA